MCRLVYYNITTLECAVGRHPVHFTGMLLHTSCKRLCVYHLFLLSAFGGFIIVHLSSWFYTISTSLVIIQSLRHMLQTKTEWLLCAPGFVPHSSQVTSSKRTDTLIFHTTMCRHSIKL